MKVSKILLPSNKVLPPEMLIIGLTTVNSAIYPRASPQLTLKKWCSLCGSVSVSDLWMRVGAGPDRLTACLKSTGFGCNWESRPPFWAKAWPDRMPEVLETHTQGNTVVEQGAIESWAQGLKFLSCLCSTTAGSHVSTLLWCLYF